MNVLLVKTSSLGDIVHATYAVTEANRARPDVAIDWCVEAPFVEVVRMHPGVRTIHVSALRRWRGRPLAAATWAEARELLRALRSPRYDLVIDAQGLVKSAVVARLAGAPVHGYDRASAREPLASVGYSVRHQVSQDRHAVDRMRLLVAAALGYAADPAPPASVLRPPPPPAAAHGRDDLAVLLHGTTWSSKRWPPAFWVDLARDLVQEGYRPVLPWSDEVERGIVAAITSAVPDALSFPRSSLTEIAGLLGASRLVVGGDTGLMHLAAAFGVRTVSLFASSSRQLAGPVGVASSALQTEIACSPCLKRECPLVPKGVDPPCHATLRAGDVIAELVGHARTDRPALVPQSA